MYWRRLTETEKRKNQHQRITRCKTKEKHQRRQDMFERLGHLIPSPDILETVLSPSEAFSMQYRPFQKGRAMEQLIQLRLCRLAGHGANTPVCPEDTPHRAIAAPLLHRSRRCLIFPWLVPPVRSALPAGMALVELKAEAKSWKTASFDPFATLDRLHSFTGCWEQAADLELRLGLITTPISPEMISEIARAREFWNNWSVGYHHYRSAVAAGLLPQLEGNNWTCCDHAGLMELLPGVRLPRSVLRDFYLLLLEGGVRGRRHRLVICSTNGHHLAIHPF